MHNRHDMVSPSQDGQRTEPLQVLEVNQGLLLREFWRPVSLEHNVEGKGYGCDCKYEKLPLKRIRASLQHRPHGTSEEPD